MKLAIIDDNEGDRSILKEYLEDYICKRKIKIDIACFCNGEEFLTDYKSGEFSLIFLDIYMGIIDGMTVAKKIHKNDPDCLLIFVTQSDVHAVESYQVRAFYYLVKPFTKDYFNEILDLCCETLLQKSSFLEVKEGRTKISILLRDLFYVDTYGHYVQLHTSHGIIKSRMTFREISELIKQDPRFLGTYRNVLVNMERIETIDSFDFILHNKERVPIQRKLLTQVKQTFVNYLFQKTKGGQV